MQRIESYQRPAFLKAHPPVLARMILASGTEETVFLRERFWGGMKTAIWGPGRRPAPRWRESWSET